MNIAVLTSGGVDSSVALKLLKEEGHKVTAFYLKIWLEDDLVSLGDCPWEEDLGYVRTICERENIPLKIISLQTEYFDRVVNYAIQELKAGRTPSPDVLCNKNIKFGAFFEKIDNQFDAVASGHYATLDHFQNMTRLKVAKDPIKDQTYFLTHLTREQLRKALFPLGGYSKKEVRKLAHDFNLPNKDRKDSQGICFLGKIKYSDFVRHYLKESTGDIINIDNNKKLGCHKGYWFYTVGQRQGLGLSGGPWFVVKKDISENVIYVSNKNHMENKARQSFKVGKFNWINDSPEDKNLLTKIRHCEFFTPCSFEMESDNTATVTLDREDAGIAPGQFAAFYKDDVCLGGGTIIE